MSFIYNNSELMRGNILYILIILLSDDLAYVVFFI
jgi:hypothetical protein